MFTCSSCCCYGEVSSGFGASHPLWSLLLLPWEGRHTHHRQGVPCTHDSPDTVTSWGDDLVVIVALMMSLEAFLLLIKMGTDA